MDFGVVLVLLTILGFAFYKWCTAKYSTFKSRGITSYDKPVPLLGNLSLDVVFQKTSFLRFIIDHHLKFKDSKVSGVYIFRDPSIFIKDIDLIKKVGIKDFDTFTNHQDSVQDTNNVLSKSLIMLKNKKWKEMRSTLSPVFTGIKMRTMFNLIHDCSVEANKHLQKELASSENKEVNIEIKDFFTRFTNDVIASAAFGIKINSYENRDNEFFTIGTSITQFKGWTLVKAFLVGFFPKLMKLLRVQIMDEKKINYFKGHVYEAMKYREKHNISRPDMIQLLQEAQRQSKVAPVEKDAGEHADFNDEDLLAQCLLFFFAGFDTVSTCLCFTMYELAMNADAQEQLYNEILETKEQLKGEPINYDTLVAMKYLDMVLSESLRKWPPAIITDRKCSADYTLKDDDDNIVAEIKKDDLIFIPIIGIHHDPDNFPDPEKFEPERFSDDRKDEIKPMTYLPFGIGPRSCIGNRFALMETKAIIYQILSEFKVVPGEKTPENLMNAIKGFQMAPEEKFWVKFVPRTS